MNPFRQEQDPSGVKGLLALLRSNQDAAAGTSSAPSPSLPPPSGLAPRPLHHPSRSPSNSPQISGYSPSFSRASYPSSSSSKPRPAAPAAADRASPQAGATGHALEDLSTATDHSYLQQWQAQTQMPSMPVRSSSAAAGLSESGSVPHAGNPDLKALLDKLKSSSGGASSSQPLQHRPPQPSSTPSRKASIQPQSILKSSSSSSSTRPAPGSFDGDETDPSSSRKKRKLDSSSDGTGFGFFAGDVLSVSKGKSLLKAQSTSGPGFGDAGMEGQTMVKRDGKWVPETAGGNGDGNGNGSGAGKVKGKAPLNREMPFSQAIGVIAELLEDKAVVRKVKEMKKAQDGMEREMWTKRERLVKEFDRRLTLAQTKNIPSSELHRLATERQYQLQQHDLSLLKRFSALQDEQQKALEELGVPGMGRREGEEGRGEMAEWRKRRGKVVGVLEEGVSG